MLTIIGTYYECEHCPSPRPYVNKAHCQAHERRCYYNPTTKSCASCASFRFSYEPIPEMPRHACPIQSCDQGIDISGNKLKTGCELYIKRDAGF